MCEYSLKYKVVVIIIIIIIIITYCYKYIIIIIIIITLIYIALYNGHLFLSQFLYIKPNFYFDGVPKIFFIHVDFSDWILSALLSLVSGSVRLSGGGL